MKILALDSTAKVASVALYEDGRVLSAFSVDAGLHHSELLLPMVETALKMAKVSLSEINYYAVTVGPGSFTGVRIGTALVKGLALRYPETETKNCIPVSTLEALAENLFGLDGILCPVMDARRLEVYNALFRYENGTLVRLTADRAISLSELLSELSTRYAGIPVRLVGDGYSVALAALSGKLMLPETPPLLREQSAASVARCAHRILEAGGAVSDRMLAPRYLRLPQAERERLAREKKDQ